MLALALSRALGLFQKHLKAPHLVKAAQDRLLPDVQGEGVKKADLIIEAIVEKLDAKQQLFAQIAKMAKKEALLASNTSTIPLNALSQDPDVQRRLIGLHFFNPVAKMPLVEVISGKDLDPLFAQQGMAFVKAIEKLPLPVKSAPGFLVNRVLMPYLLESIVLVESGISETAIDKAAVAFGMPMGPIELIDTIGLDVCLYAAKSLVSYFGGAIPARLEQLVEEKKLGKKTQQGFYAYKNGKALKPVVPQDYRLPDDLMDRLVLSMANQAMACLREHIVPDADHLDAGLLFGMGFPAFKGGLMHDVEAQGRALVLQRLNLLAERYGERFATDPGWETLGALEGCFKKS